jgi:hypothetical protein
LLQEPRLVDVLRVLPHPSFANLGNGDIGISVYFGVEFCGGVATGGATQILLDDAQPEIQDSVSIIQQTVDEDRRL